jgi:mono/diheme cytochrome c family protein
MSRLNAKQAATRTLAIDKFEATVRAVSMVFLLMGCLPVATAGADESRGRLLYENHCASCHDKRLHQRDQHLPENLGELQREVERWQQNQGLHWGREEIADVVDYLNASQYRF